MPNSNIKQKELEQIINQYRENSRRKDLSLSERILNIAFNLPASEGIAKYKKELMSIAEEIKSIESKEANEAREDLQLEEAVKTQEEKIEKLNKRIMFIEKKQALVDEFIFDLRKR